MWNYGSRFLARERRTANLFHGQPVTAGLQRNSNLQRNSCRAARRALRCLRPGLARKRRCVPTQRRLLPVLSRAPWIRRPANKRGGSLLLMPARALRYCWSYLQQPCPQLVACPTGSAGSQLSNAFCTLSRCLRCWSLRACFSRHRVNQTGQPTQPASWLHSCWRLSSGSSLQSW